MSDILVRLAEPAELETLFDIRREVFVRGQGVPEDEEIDGLDADCVHFIALRAGAPIGTARMRTYEGESKAERVAVLERERVSGVGRALMTALEAEARRGGAPSVRLNAQVAVEDFYAKLGYAPFGAQFWESGILHQAMRKTL